MEKAAHVLVGLLFAGDGLQKLAGALGDGPSGVPAAIIWIAGAIELAGGLLAAARARRMATPALSNSWPLDRRTHEAR